MAEHRKPYMSLKIRRTSLVVVFEVFEASLWSNRPSAAKSALADRFRIRRDGRWICDGDKYTFFDMDAVVGVLIGYLKE